MPNSPNATFFFFNDTATTEIYTLSLHDALPIYIAAAGEAARQRKLDGKWVLPLQNTTQQPAQASLKNRSEEHTSELQSLAYLVCRLLLEKKKKHWTASIVLRDCSQYTWVCT